MKQQFYFGIDVEYHWANVCWHLYEWLGWSNGGRPVDGLMVPNYPKIQGWLSSQIPYDSW